MARRPMVTAAAAALAALGLALAVRWGAPDGAPSPGPRPVPARGRPIAAPPGSPLEVPPTEATATEATATEAAAAFAGRAAEVAARCDLPVKTRCDGDACAGLMVAPDLDQLSGWVRLVWTSPRFVATTAGRELGVPLAGMPCAGAVDALVSAPDAHGVLAIEHADGTEVWCAVSGDPARALALCDEGLRALSPARPQPDPATASFARPGVRRLRFDR